MPWEYGPMGKGALLVEMIALLISRL
jgi:hypothetical protein